MQKAQRLSIPVFDIAAPRKDLSVAPATREHYSLLAGGTAEPATLMSDRNWVPHFAFVPLDAFIDLSNALPDPPTVFVVVKIGPETGKVRNIGSSRVSAMPGDFWPSSGRKSPRVWPVIWRLS